MKLYLLLIICLITFHTVFSQTTYTLRADSVKITNCDSAELILENHTQAVPGFLYNTGNGRTQFKRAAIRLNDTIYLVGADTIKLPHAWVQGGNAFGTTGILGTKDSNHLDLYTNGRVRARLASNGNLMLNTTTDNGFNLNVNGEIYSSSTAILAGGAGQIYPDGEFFVTAPATHPPTFRLTSTDASATRIWFYVNNTFMGEFVHDGSHFYINPYVGGISFYLSGVAKAEIAPTTGNFLIGTAHDVGNKLRVVGSADFYGPVGIGDSAATSQLDIQGANGYSQLRIRTHYTPTSSSDTNGNPGDIAVDDNYIYYKTSTGWKRSPLGTF